MANNNNGKNGKKNNAGAATDAGAQQQTPAPKKSSNIQDRHGNAQIRQTIATAQEAQKKPDSVLSTMVDQEQEQVQGQEWWKDEVVQKEEEEEVQLTSKKDDPDKQKSGRDRMIEDAAAEKVLMARAVLVGQDPNQVDIEGKNEALTQQEEAALEEIERLEAQGKMTEQGAMLVLADAKGMDEQDKAKMLIDGSSEVKQSDVVGQTAELQALLAAEQLPSQLGDFDRDAAELISSTPMDERQTLRSVTEEIKLIAQQMHNHPALMDPNASVEQKATALVGVLAYELDVPTRESLAAHPFTALTEELIFEPAAMMEVNRVAGSRRDIRQMGSFAVVLWQIMADSARLELDAIGDDKLINEKDFLSGMLTDMSNKMYVDAMARPGW